jgi:TnpA family transposase
MKREWTPDELAEQWALSFAEHQVVGKKTGSTRLGFAVLLKFIQVEGRFPHHPRDVPMAVVEYIAPQLGLSPALWERYVWSGSTVEYHRAQIRRFLGFREVGARDTKSLTVWLSDAVLPHTQELEQVKARLFERCRELRLEPPALDRVERLVRSALHVHEERFCSAIYGRLPAAARAQLDNLLAPPAGGGTASETTVALLHFLKADPGRASLESIQEELVKLEVVRATGLPGDLFAGVAPQILRTYRHRVAVEESYELRRHPDALRTTLLAAFCSVRGPEIFDGLVDLLVGTVHRIESRAERKVDRQLLDDFKRVAGKDNLLFQVADASLAHPDGVVREVVYPIVNEETLRALVKEWKASGPRYRRIVQTTIRRSYQAYYRRMMPALIKALPLRSSNERHRPVMRAVELVRSYLGSKLRFYPVQEDVPLEGVVREAWLDAVVDTDADGTKRVNRITYEVCALSALREKLRCKEIWVAGANRYRNPDEDLPADFASSREAHYVALKLPLSAQQFIEKVRQEMKEELGALDRELPRNPDVSIQSKAGGRISLTPLEAQAEPQRLVAVKSEVARRWPMTSLLDILKETDLRVGFTEVFRSATVRENLERSVLRPRFLLCLYGLGTNTGLKRVSAGAEDVTYKDLLYVRRRFLTVDLLRDAIRRVVNATLRVRQPHIWGEGTTACASDSKKFGAWDQNLMTEWHVRYGGRGVMIYWHVERKAICIYSQLKTCSSSEVAAMIEGVLRHCTEMRVEKNYVDTHGQSEVAFAFCRLLGFQLLPRLKGINRQRLYRPEPGKPDEYPNLQSVLSRPIDWDLIGQQYDEMVKYATALRVGTSDAESILRRFTRTNVQHPTYRALAELGKAERTTFLCRYLRRKEQRREIHEGLNVIENWNSANAFIHYGRGGEMATNNRDDQETGMLCLHLLQACLVYVNTIMVQQVLSAPAWMDQMGPEELRALTPLIYNHVTPYGTFNLDMEARLLLDGAVDAAATTASQTEM